jgi:peptidyl-prolyl cis-trans isomerase C
MDYFGKKVFVLGLTGTMVIALTGCDLINPPKKALKETSASPTTPAVEIKTTNIDTESQGPLPANVVVRVGEWKLTNDEFNQRLKLLKQGLPDFDEKDPTTKATVLNELIRQQLLVKDAEASNIVEQKDIKEAIEDFRRTLLVQELANRITKGLVATESEAQKYYEENKQRFVEPIKWKVRQIVVNDEAAAKNVLVQVLQGGDFEALAKAQSKDKSAAQGGVIPEFIKAPSEAMQKAISSLEAGGTSSVFKDSQGFCIVRVDEKKGGTAKSFVELKKDLIEGLTLRKQQQAILDHIDQLSQKTKVEVNNELLGLGDKK